MRSVENGAITGICAIAMVIKGTRALLMNLIHVCFKILLMLVLVIIESFYFRFEGENEYQI